MPTTFNVFFLGNHSTIDPTEGNTQAEDAGGIVGATFGSALNPLYDSIQTLAPGSTGFGGGSSDASYDQDNNAANETFTIDGGAEQTFDSVAVYTATITYFDDTTDTFTAIIFQDTAGNKYLAPQSSANANQTVMEAKAMQSITIDSLVGDTYSGMTGTRQAGNYPGPVDGTSGNDNIALGYTDSEGETVTNGDDLIEARDGDDTISGGNGSDIIFGGAGNDFIGDPTGSGGAGSDILYGEAGNDTIHVGNGQDTGYGGDDADLFTSGGSGFGKTVVGGEGGNDNDTLSWAGVSDAGDTVSLTFAGDEDGSATIRGQTVTFSEIEAVAGTEVNDSLDGSAVTTGANISGNAGDDTILGGSGNDTLDGNAGSDSITAGQGADTISGGDGADTVDGGDGDDTIAGGDGNDSLSAGLGNDTLRGDGGDDSLYGEGGDDLLVGGDGVDLAIGGDGQDTIEGQDGDDILDGAEGDDRILGGAGADTMYGGLGTDTFVIQDGYGNDSIRAGENTGDADLLDLSAVTTGLYFRYTNQNAGYAETNGFRLDFIQIERVSFGSGNDQLSFGASNNEAIWAEGNGGNDTILASAFDDSIYGGTGNDRIYGNTGNDLFFGDAGNDELYGGPGDDTLYGGADADEITGGSGNDLFFGGAGDDVFIFDNDGGDDTVSDFAAGDLVDISGLTDVGNASTNEDGEVRANEVVVTGGGGSDQLLTFPNGETLQVPDGTVDTSSNAAQIASLVAMGVPPCFAPGTMIRIATGEAPVETLQIGDYVMTADHGLQKLRWIGKRVVDFSDPSNPRADRDRPILFARGSLGTDLPRQDLVVSPQHRMVLSGGLVEAKFGVPEVLGMAKGMVRLPGVRQMHGKHEIAYYALMFDRHQIIFANGARVESFRPGPVALEGLLPSQLADIELVYPGLSRDIEKSIGPPARKIIKRRDVIGLCIAKKRQAAQSPPQTRSKPQGSLEDLARQQAG